VRSTQLRIGNRDAAVAILGQLRDAERMILGGARVHEEVVTSKNVSAEHPGYYKICKVRPVDSAAGGFKRVEIPRSSRELLEKSAALL
jgi:hypothetical protein